MKDKFIGCMLGGAVGDALGYPVEFDKRAGILKQYGTSGITDYALRDGVAQISDDTQMTLFTADGLLLADENGAENDMDAYGTWIWNAYTDWYKTQGLRAYEEQLPCYTRIGKVRQMHDRRAPGMTCLSSIASGIAGSVDMPTNDSKGCGGIMRVAPVALYCAAHNKPAAWADLLGAQAAALTHGHPLGFIPSAALVHLIMRLLSGDNVTIQDAVQETLQAVQKQFVGFAFLDGFVQIVEKALQLAAASDDDATAIAQLGEGWVAEETFAIAVYCAVKHSNDFVNGVVAAANHDGDSDSTGAVAGNILGAYLGAKSIPAKFTDTLELRQEIEELATSLL